MANVKISDLPDASALDGTELVPLVQSGTTSKTAASTLRGIPIPATNETGGVQVAGADGAGSGSGEHVYVYGGDAGSGTGGRVEVVAGDSSTGDGGDVLVKAGGGDYGGNLTLRSGGGVSGNGLLLLQAPAASGGIDAGSIQLDVGQGGAGGSARGRLIFSCGLGGSPIMDANNAQTVTVGNVGPGGASVSIIGWLPVTVDGNDAWLPVFGV